MCETHYLWVLCYGQNLRKNLKFALLNLLSGLAILNFVDFVSLANTSNIETILFWMLLQAKTVFLLHKLLVLDTLYVTFLLQTHKVCTQSGTEVGPSYLCPVHNPSSLISGVHHRQVLHGHAHSRGIGRK